MTERKGLLHDPVKGGDSATRAVAIGFAAAFIFRVFYMTLLGMAMGKSDAIAIACVVFAIPIGKLFEGAGGLQLAGKLFDALGSAAATGANASANAVQSVIGRFRHRHDPDA